MIETVEELIPLPVGEIALSRPRDPDALATEEAYVQDEFLPYWAELWASSVELARDISRRSLRGAPVLELGCGLGLPSIAAALAGGRVLATDWAADAIETTAANAARNGAEVETAVVSWTAPDAIVERGPWPLVIASDVLYEPRNVDQLIELLPRLVDSRSKVLIADPGRSAAERFLELAPRRWEVRTRGRIHRLRLKS